MGGANELSREVQMNYIKCKQYLKRMIDRGATPTSAINCSQHSTFGRDLHNLIRTVPYWKFKQGMTSYSNKKAAIGGRNGRDGYDQL